MQMQPITLTADKLADFRRMAQQRLATNKQINPFTHLLARMIVGTDRANRKWNTDCTNERISFAEKHANGVLKKDQRGNLDFKMEKQQELNEALEELANDWSCEITPEYATFENIPDDLTPEELVAFEGIVINPSDVTEIVTNKETNAPAAADTAKP